MKKTILTLMLLLLICIPAVSWAATPADTTPFSSAVASITKSFVDNLNWSVGYVRSIKTPQREGVVLKASRYIQDVKFGHNYSVKFDADLIAIQSSGNDNNLYGLGISADLSKLAGVSAGISYLPGGYGWALTLTPVSIKF